MGFRYFPRFFAGAAIAVSTFLVACLDIPSTPDVQNKIDQVQVLVEQDGVQDSTLLKVNSTKDSKLIAKVNSQKYKDQVKYYWYRDSDLLDSGSVYELLSVMVLSETLRNLYLPNRLVVLDNENNKLESSFDVICNAPPVLSNKTTPAEGDSLYGTRSTPFLFEWQSQDTDKNQELTHILEIDDVRYSVGSLTQVKQSGLSIGIHQFRVLVADSYGDMDSTSWRTFYVNYDRMIIP